MKCRSIHGFISGISNLLYHYFTVANLEPLFYIQHLVTIMYCNEVKYTLRGTFIKAALSNTDQSSHCFIWYFANITLFCLNKSLSFFELSFNKINPSDAAIFCPSFDWHVVGSWPFIVIPATYQDHCRNHQNVFVFLMPGKNWWHYRKIKCFRLCGF